jgi:hypothetical protein
MADVLSFDKIFYTNFEPKLQNRFIMEIDGIPSFMIKSANRPKIESEVVELDHINLKRKIKGKSNWTDITITMYDPIVPSGAQAVMEWIRTSHESITGRDGYADFYKKNIDFYALGPVGDKVEQWKLVGAFISNAEFGDFNWSNGADPVEITLTITYDYAILEF